MRINYEKILTISAEAYCKMIGNELNDYTPVGVHGRLTDMSVPKDTEVVVDYRPLTNAEYDEFYDRGFGTALVKKGRTELEEEVQKQNEN